MAGTLVTSNAARVGREAAPPRALTIAGSDSGGGAGIQADLKTFCAFGVYGMSALTAITAQNTLGVTAAVPVDPQLVRAQIDAVRDDLGVDACKTGMLANKAIVLEVVAAVARGGLGPIVVDPVLVSKHGVPLLEPEACDTLRQELLPLATVVTPNLPEAAVLLGCHVGDLGPLQARRQAAAALFALGPRHVVLKGGHSPQAGAEGEENLAIDVWFDGQATVEIRAPRIQTRHTHGTGCTFSAAIVAGLALGRPIADAIPAAKEFITWAIAHAPGLGGGSGPVNHLRPLGSGGSVEHA